MPDGLAHLLEGGKGPNDLDVFGVVSTTHTVLLHRFLLISMCSALPGKLLRRSSRKHTHEYSHMFTYNAALLNPGEGSSKRSPIDSDSFVWSCSGELRTLCIESVTHHQKLFFYCRGGPTAHTKTTNTLEGSESLCAR